MKNKFAIGIPTLNRADLLVPSLRKYAKDFEGIDITVFDNGNQYEYIFSDFIEIENRLPCRQESMLFEHYNKIKIRESYSIKQDSQYPSNIGVAASWNMLCKRIFYEQGHDWALLVNDDVYLGYGTETVNEAIMRSKVGIVQSAFNWSVVLISKELYEKVGRFDEIFHPAYYEDSDYMYRLKLMGLRHEVDTTLNPVQVKVGGTEEKAPELVRKSMADNRQRYIDKWGYLPLLETYKTPYNQ